MKKKIKNADLNTTVAERERKLEKQQKLGQILLNNYHVVYSTKQLINSSNENYVLCVRLISFNKIDGNF